MKMYILVLDTVPDAFVPVMTAHSSLMNYKKYEDTPSMIEWMETSFKKVVCRVSQGEFDKAKSSCTGYTITTENNLHDMECTITFCPREEWPECFRYFRLWKPTEPTFQIKESTIDGRIWDSSHRLEIGQTPREYFLQEGYDVSSNGKCYRDDDVFEYEQVEGSLIFELYKVEV